MEHTNFFISFSCYCGHFFDFQDEKIVNADQEKLVSLVTAVKSLPLDKVIQTVTQLVGSGHGLLSAASFSSSGRVSGSNARAGSPIFGLAPSASSSLAHHLASTNHGRGEHPLLEFFRSYVGRCSAAQLVECWPSLALLVREALAVAASATSSATAATLVVVGASPAFVAANCTVSHVFTILYTFVNKVSTRRLMAKFVLSKRGAKVDFRVVS
jgi:hypothetical protein